MFDPCITHQIFRCGSRAWKKFQALYLFGIAKDAWLCTGEHSLACHVFFHDADDSAVLAVPAEHYGLLVAPQVLWTRVLSA